jgi:DNA-binding CsgD family transcriptional regulator
MSADDRARDVEEASGRLAGATSAEAFEAELGRVLASVLGATAARLHEPVEAPPLADGWARLELRDRRGSLGWLDVFPAIAEREEAVAFVTAGAALALRAVHEAAEARRAVEAAEARVRMLEAALLAATASAEGVALVGPGGEVAFGDPALRVPVASPAPARRAARIVTPWDPVAPAARRAVKEREVADLPGYRLILPYDSDKRVERRTARMREEWGLTPARAHVLAYVARGLSNKEIASLLDITEATVEAHLTAILRASGTPSRAALVASFWSAS